MGAPRGSRKSTDAWSLRTFLMRSRYPEAETQQLTNCAMPWSGPFTGATRRAAPSLQSSGIVRIVRIDFRPVLIYMLYVRVYMRAPCVPGSPLRVFSLYPVDNRIHAYSPFRTSAEVLANYTPAANYRLLAAAATRPSGVFSRLWNHTSLRGGRTP
jgi:hypothetical protein